MPTVPLAAILRVLAAWLALEVALRLALGRLDPFLPSVARAFVALAVWSAALLALARLWHGAKLRPALRRLGITVLPGRLLLWPLGVLALVVLFHVGDGNPPVPGWPTRLTITVVAAALTEELVFRAFLYGELRGSFAVWPAALLSGVCFAAAHLTPAAFARPFPMGQLALALALSIPLALLWERGGSLWPCALLHLACDLSVPFPLATSEAAGIENRLVLIGAWFVAIALMRGGVLGGRTPRSVR